MALVVLSVVEQRLDAVRLVLAGASVSEVAAQVGVSRQSVHMWLGRYLSEGVAGLADRSSRPKSCPHQAPVAVERVVVELRREHPRWGAKRIRLELLRAGPGWRPEARLATEEVPSTSTINRILLRQGLVKTRPRKRPRSSFKRFERPGPMQLWGIDIVGGITLVDTSTGELREAKIVTGIDDHSRFCVMAAVVERATGRAVCLAFAQALARYGAPEEVITDNGRQFTDRFSRYGPSRGEVLFDKICRKNGIAHRLTAPASPNQNGKVERFHGTFRPEISEQGPFESVTLAQAAVDAWVAGYNAERPHQGLDERAPVVPADRFAPVAAEERALVELWLPPALDAVTGPETVLPAQPEPALPVPAMTSPVATTPAAGALEFDRVVPPTGMITVARKALWMGGYRAGQTVRVWADVDVIHLLIDGVRVKSLRSHLSASDLAKLVAQGAVPAGHPPLPEPDGSDAVEVDRVVSHLGMVSLANRVVIAAEILAGRQVSIRIEPEQLMFFDPVTRELLRTRPNPLSPAELEHVRGRRKAGPPPLPSTEPIRVQRKAWSNGRLMVAGQKVMVGRDRADETVTIYVSETTLRLQFDDGETRIVRRTNDNPIRRIKSQRPRTAHTSVS